jgi:MFS family permease
VDKRRSLFALDWLNFFMADAETGVGPFVSTYLAAIRHLDPAQVGMVVAAQSIATVVSQTPAGWLIDASRRKKLLLMLAALVITLGCLLIVHAGSVTLQIANQVAIGAAVVLVSPAVAAISLGIVGRRALPLRLGRNSAFSHSGNALTALLAGYLGFRVGQQWIFYSSALFGFAAIASAALIRNADIDNQAARALAPEASTGQHGPVSVLSLLREGRILVFVLAVVIFHVANAALLPLAGQELAHANPQSSSLYMSACIVAAQLMMAPVAFLVGRLTGRVGRKPIFLVAFGVVALRGVLFSLGAGGAYIVFVQVLDGFATGVAGILTTVVISDLAKGTGRFNLLVGMAQTSISAGAFCSHLLAGFTAKSFGFVSAFHLLSVIAVAGFVLYALFMPETLEQETFAS